MSDLDAAIYFGETPVKNRQLFTFFENLVPQKLDFSGFENFIIFCVPIRSRKIAPPYVILRGPENSKISEI